MKFILTLLLILPSLAFAEVSEKDLFKIKVEHDKKQFELKIIQEQELSKLLGKEINLNNKVDMDCVEYVYQGSSSRQESVEACQGVINIECVKFVYQGSSSRVESAKACRAIRNMECVSFVYQGSSSRVESARACLGVNDMECVRFVYQGSSSRVESARSCSRHQPNECR